MLHHGGDWLAPLSARQIAVQVNRLPELLEMASRTEQIA
jgi:hypothetical protein